MKHTELVSEYRDGIARAVQLVHDRFSDLTEAQFNWKRSHNAWSIGQCIQHINMVGRHWTKKLDLLIPRAQAGGGDEEFRPGRIGQRMMRSLDPDRRKLRRPATRARFRPHFNVYTIGCLNEFFEIQQRLLSFSAKLAGLNMMRNKVAPHNLPLLKVPLGDALLLINRHSSWFLRYAENLLWLDEFPRKNNNDGQPET